MGTYFLSGTSGNDDVCSSMRDNLMWGRACSSSRQASRGHIGGRRHSRAAELKLPGVPFASRSSLVNARRVNGGASAPAHSTYSLGRRHRGRVADGSPPPARAYEGRHPSDGGAGISPGPGATVLTSRST
jgi:hypothetical protein